MPRTPKPRTEVTPPRPKLVRRPAPRRAPAPQAAHDEIAVRAYLIFEREGFAHGHALDHWLQAERELVLERRPAPIRRVAKANGA